MTLEMLDLAILDVAAFIAFAVVLLGFLGSVALVGMILFALAQCAWRWLARHTWNSLIVRLERKAFR